jgi:hypothetical protein
MAALLGGRGKNLKNSLGLLLIGSKCKMSVCWEDFFALQQQEEAMKQSSLLQEKRILWFVGWLVGRLEARWWMDGWVGCCKVEYASAFTEDMTQTRHNCL